MAIAALSIPSEAEREPAAAPEEFSPDQSLAPDAYSHRGLFYPYGRSGPEFGELTEIRPGLFWTRSPVPGSLRHINIWLIASGEGLTIVDTGLASDAAREAWEQLLSGPLRDRRVDTLLVTHFHPDHVGLAGWLARRLDAPLWMTRGEWLFARMLSLDVRAAPPEEAPAFWRAAGWSEERIAAEAAKGWGRFASAVTELPIGYRRLQDGRNVELGGRTWRIVTGSGHSPEHACLLDEEAKILIAGDQVLPRITSNISVGISEPEADPLGEWLDSIEKLRQLPDDLLVLPSHGEPFVGLHARLDALAQGHHGRLDALVEFLSEPKRAVDCFGILFGRKVDDRVLGLATGEALAHLRRLELDGRAVRRMEDGVAFYQRA